MSSLLTYLLIGALVATAVMLILGILDMFSSRNGASERGNKLMQGRVAAQAIVLILFTLLLLARKG